MRNRFEDKERNLLVTTITSPLPRTEMDMKVEQALIAAMELQEKYYERNGPATLAAVAELRRQATRLEKSLVKDVNKW